MGSWAEKVSRLKYWLAASALGLMAGPALAATCSPSEVLLRWPGGSARFSVELADDAEERAQGLMFREKMAREAGMLFVYPRPQFAAFWMKNTLIPLDMLFIDERGRVKSIHADAIPGDETLIPGGNGVLAVLEINGGLAEALGIKVGAEMRHPIFGETAHWPC